MPRPRDCSTTAGGGGAEGADLMRGSADAVAVARDVVSSSPSKAASALDMMRYQRPSSDFLPLPNGIGGGGGASRKPQPAAAAGPRSSKDDVAPAVATDSSRLAAFLASTSLEPKPRTRAPQPAAHQAAPSPAPASAAAATRSPARDHGHHHHHNHHSDLSDPSSPSSTGGGVELLLQWGQNKRSRGRREAASSSNGASPQRRQTVSKIQRRSSSAAADKLMPPPSGPSYTRGSSLRVASSLPPRSGDVHHGRAAVPHHNSRSAEERAAGKSAASGKAAQPQQTPHKAGSGPVIGLCIPEPKQSPQHQPHHHHHHHPGAAAASASKPAAKLEVPRIYTTLSRKEKEDDFLAMKGTKLPQRPKRRPKNVEKTVNLIVPGMWLTDVTRSRYEVREKKCPKKQQKNRGLKGMESMESDSE